MMPPNKRRLISWFSISIILSAQGIPSGLYASDELSAAPLSSNESQRISVVILQKTDGISDEITADSAAALREALPHIAPVHVIPQQIVDNVAQYHQRYDNPAGKNESAEENLARAKDHYFGFHYDEATAEIKRVIEILGGGSISQNGALLHDALITSGIIAKSAGDNALAGESFEKAVRLSPLYKMDRAAFSPSIVESYEKSRQGLVHGELGTLRVESDPGAAEVYINGILHGVTPLELTGMPPASYTVLIKTNKYQPVEKVADIAGGRETKIDERLFWIREGNKKGITLENERNEIREDIRIADLLKSDKAILINCDESSGNGEVIARMVDRKYRSAYKKIIVKYNGIEGRSAALADMANALAMQAQADIAKDPMKYLDTEGVGDPILLGSRKKEFHKKPIFWGVIGAAAAGAIAGGIMAALSGGSPDTGSIKVQFK